MRGVNKRPDKRQAKPKGRASEGLQKVKRSPSPDLSADPQADTAGEASGALVLDKGPPQKAPGPGRGGRQRKHDPNALKVDALRVPPWMVERLDTARTALAYDYFHVDPERVVIQDVILALLRLGLGAMAHGARPGNGETLEFSGDLPRVELVQVLGDAFDRIHEKLDAMRAGGGERFVPFSFGAAEAPPAVQPVFDATAPIVGGDVKTLGGLAALIAELEKVAQSDAHDVPFALNAPGLRAQLAALSHADRDDLVHRFAALGSGAGVAALVNEILKYGVGAGALAAAVAAFPSESAS